MDGMKRIISTLLLLAALAGFAVVSPVAAQTAESLSDAHSARIKNNCQSAIAILGQIRTNDGPVYVNRNQAYFSISDKLIARLNSRLALGRYDTTPLVKIAGDYNQSLTDFRAAYKRYNDAMVELTRMNCSQRPTDFYAKAEEVRELRQKVHEVVEKLRGLIADYRQAVEAFRLEHASQLGGGSND